MLGWAAQALPDRVALACSFGVEDCVLVDLLARVAPRVTAFYLDTGLLFPESHDTRERLVQRYGTRFEAVVPALSVDEQAIAHGPELWRRQPDVCCQRRKVEPLQSALSRLDGWITGIRREQTPARAQAALIEWDPRFGLIKCNPLAAWTAEQVWTYVRERDVPYNPMHDRGFPSIGCWPCTRRVAAGEDPRAGRWAGFAKTECGLHS